MPLSRSCTMSSSELSTHVREQDDPGVADVVVEVDLALRARGRRVSSRARKEVEASVAARADLGGLGVEVRRLVTEAESDLVRHDCSAGRREGELALGSLDGEPR